MYRKVCEFTTRRSHWFVILKLFFVIIGRLGCVCLLSLNTDIDNAYWVLILVYAGTQCHTAYCCSQYLNHPPWVIIAYPQYTPLIIHTMEVSFWFLWFCRLSPIPQVFLCDEYGRVYHARPHTNILYAYTKKHNYARVLVFWVTLYTYRHGKPHFCCGIMCRIVDLPHITTEINS